MNQKASSIGDLALGLLSEGKAGKVTRVFQRSAYVRSGEDFLLLLWGGLRSPMTINVEGDLRAAPYVRVDMSCKLSKEAVVLDAGRIDVSGAEVFRSKLLGRRKVILPKPRSLKKGVAMLRSLYEVSPSAPTLNGDRALKSFVRRTVVPFAYGESAQIYDPANYAPLIGRGGGFTPAGDDFVGGFAAAFNYIARCRQSRQIQIPRRTVSDRTVPESATVLIHSAKGYVDEGMERLVLKTLGGSPGFYDELMEVAHRGHTSGIDMSLGVLLCEAAVADADSGAGVLEDCLYILWHP